MENKKINVAELLKDCPSGMELDCTIWDNVKFQCVSLDGLWIAYTDSDSKNRVIHLTRYGSLKINNIETRCVIFPKGKTTWEGFIPPCKFNDGDIIVDKNENIAIYKQIHDSFDDQHIDFYCGFLNSCKKFTIKKHTFQNWGKIKDIRLATVEEKQKLFDVIEESGYKWNAETKTLDKLIVPKFNDGDIIYIECKYDSFIFIYKGLDEYLRDYICISVSDEEFYDGNNDKVCKVDRIQKIRLATEEEKQKFFKAIKDNGYRWNVETKTLEKLIIPKFKIGDKITNGKRSIIIDYIDDEYYYETGRNIANRLFIKYQDEWELVLDKFDVTTLKPFNEVLVRDHNDEKWNIDFFGYYNKGFYHTTGSCSYKQCVPYKDNEYLRGTNNDCKDFYKTWEE